MPEKSYEEPWSVEQNHILCDDHLWMRSSVFDVSTRRAPNRYSQKHGDESGGVAGFRGEESRLKLATFVSRWDRLVETPATINGCSSRA
jgi:hypothetical protein